MVWICLENFIPQNKDAKSLEFLHPSMALLAFLTLWKVNELRQLEPLSDEKTRVNQSPELAHGVRSSAVSPPTTSKRLKPQAVDPK